MALFSAKPRTAVRVGGAPKEVVGFVGTQVFRRILFQYRQQPLARDTRDTEGGE